MKVLVLGASGMIGHAMFRFLTESNPAWDVRGTLRQSVYSPARARLFSKSKVFENIDAQNLNDVTNVLSQYRPDVILNCIGITLRKAEIKDEALCEQINGKFPHFLDRYAEQNRSRLIHFSTDCVFNGKTGPYTEQSLCDAADIYGRTKAAGEVVHSEHSLTLRGSMIGRELEGKTELLEWILSKKAQTVQGYARALYSGVTTKVMAQLVSRLISEPPRLFGLYQVSSAPISKYELMKLVNQAFHLGMNIQKDSDHQTEKMLICEKIQRNFGFYCPSWPEMIEELTKDLFKYSE